ncbi:MAG: RNA polymerase sigma factor [Clostridia bacterium]|nr:RNA polymerase sigma factor [Clostridia bacterium]
MTENLTNKYCDDALCRIANGDVDALTVIYNKMGRRIFLLAFSILRDRESAEDVMQDTFLKIAAQARAYNEKSNAIAFILTITRNLSLNLLAKRRRNASYEKSLDESREIVDVENYYSSSVKSVLEALSILDDDERQIIVMKLDCGMKHKDIAILLGISESACQKRYRRALEKLKNYYKQEGKR